MPARTIPPIRKSGKKVCLERDNAQLRIPYASGNKKGKGNEHNGVGHEKCGERQLQKTVGMLNCINEGWWLNKKKRA